MASETYAPDPTNCVLGKGRIYFDRFTAAGARTGYFEIGNAKDLKADSSENRVELPNYLTSDGGIYAEGLASRQVTVSATLYEFNRKNIALLTSGTETTYTQTSSTVTGESLNTSLALGAVYQTAKRNISAITVINAATTTLTTLDWSLVDATAGLIKILTTGAAVEGGAVTVNYTAAAITASNQKIVQLHNVGTITGSLLYVSSNSAGAEGELKYWKTTVLGGSLDGLLSDTWGSSPISWKVLNDAGGTYGGSSGSPYGNWYRR